MNPTREKSTVKMTDDGIAYCEKCKAELICNEYGEMPNYCPECGRELDWTEFIRITTESDEPNETAPSPVTITLTQDELLHISDALLHVIAHNNRVAAKLIGIDDKIVRQIAEGNEKLRDLNRRICEAMTE